MISQPANSESFSRYLFKNTLNRKYLLIAMAGIFIQFILFKLCYPFADYFNDSYTYLDAAAHHYAISFRPIGYSRFLELIHLMTTSDTAVIFIQYLVLQLGILYLFFTVRFFFPLKNGISHLLFVLLIFDPVLLYISNYISSDALFVGFSLMWFTQLLWIMNRPKWIQLLLMATLLFIAFMLRYAALYLPVLALLALLFSGKNRLFTITGMALTVLPLFIAVQRIKHLTKQETGTAIFSAFGGWMATNNALHMYPYIKVQDKDFSSPDCIALNKLVKQYFDTLPVSARPYPYARVDYLWGSNTPMKTYMHTLQTQKKVKGYFNGWHATAAVLSQYSTQLIKQHPVAFARYFMWPNAREFCLPGLESLFSYNEGHDTVDSTAIRWFRYKSEQVHCANKTIQGGILAPIPWLFLVTNILFWISLTAIVVRAKYYALSAPLLRTLILTAAFWITNFCFSIYAAPIVFRFQLFPMIVCITFTMLMIQILTTRYCNKRASTT
jgi:hypothetical protein